MTPNARRAVANAICKRLRADGRGRAFQWHSQRAVVRIDGTTNPGPRSPLRYPRFHTPTPTYEVEDAPDFIETMTFADPQLGTPDLRITLSRDDHDAVTSRLHPLDDAIYRVFVTARMALPFHADGRRLRWSAKRCPAPAMLTLRALAMVADVEVIDPLDIADVFAELEPRADPDAVQDAVEAGERQEGDLHLGT